MQRMASQKGIVHLGLIVVVIVVLLVVAVLVMGGSFNFSVSKTDTPPDTSHDSSAEDNPMSDSEKAAAENQTFSGSGISFEYPADWTQSDTPVGYIGAFSSPRENDDDTFSENINVRSIDLSSQPELTVEEVANLWLTQTQDSVDDFGLLETNTTTISGAPAVQFVYNVSDQDIDGKGMIVVAVKDGTSFMVTYTAENASSYNTFLDEVNMILSTFEIL
ncbi:PsbP-related protein [Patescibacteria group bacterium]